MYFYTHFSQLFVLEVVAAAVCLGPYTRSRRRLRGHTHGAAYVDTFTPLTWTRSRRGSRGHVTVAVAGRHVHRQIYLGLALLRRVLLWVLCRREGGGGQGLLTDDTASSTSVPVYG